MRAAPFRLAAALLAAGATAIAPARAQQGAQVHGNFSTDAQYYNTDSAIGAVVPPQRFGANAWGNLIVTHGPFEAGLRFEAYNPPLAGYPAGLPYKGSGLGYRYAKFTKDGLEVTVGNFYEQFGQGLVLRSYEERYLGVDNAMDGFRLRYTPYRGVHLKGLVGLQRMSFDNGTVNGPGIVRAFDAEVSLAELLDSAWTSAHNIIIGGSFVSKYQEDRDPALVLPENVGAWAARLNYITPRWNLLAEYAHKINDPNGRNGFIYKPGQAATLSATYGTRGIGVMMGVHSFDNMFFQSDRAAPTPFDLNINFLPPLTKQHTYNLPATLYPYATQPNGEVAAQGEVFYSFKRGSPLGGKHGTKLAVNYAVAYGLDTLRLGAADDTTRRLGYRAGLFSPSERMYFQDINVELRKKVAPDWELALTYLNLVYDIDVVQGKPGKPTVYADMVILEGLHNFTDRNSVRFELQHLSTRQDLGNWATALAELTFSPHWFVAAMDQYNYVTFDETFLMDGKTEVKPERIHYPIGSVGYIKGGNRFQVNYGRQRAGIFCVGGVCRVVPAANGLSVSITSTF
ncbi:MAG: DUF6029 family protein [Flavobacteriales bacterium]|jgi:hypothetical protein|nr:DUF6029 family protein [Flavobacteriales bacterium]